MKCPKLAHLHRQQVDQWLPRAVGWEGGGQGQGWGEHVLPPFKTRSDFSFAQSDGNCSKIVVIAL